MSLTRSFWSTDTGAPSLSGTAGDLTTLLDALLVNGYNSRTVTITRTGTTATINFTGHGWRNGQILTVSGANESDYNITARCTYIDANNVSIQVANSPATPATGTITCKVASAGWSIAYTATNKRAYRMPAGTNQFYLRVDDSGTGSASYARVVFYETMSDIDTGTNPMPTTANVSGGGYIHKSSAASATTREYRFYTNGKIVHGVIRSNGTYWTRYSFGDIKSYKAGDAYACYLRTGVTTNDYQSPDGLATNTIVTFAGVVQEWFQRSHTQSGGSIRAYPFNIMKTTSSNTGGSSGSWPYPSVIEGGMFMVPLFVNEETSNSGPRGVIPGWWDTMVNMYNDSANWPEATTWSGAAGSNLDGRSWILHREGYTGDAFIVETSDTWDE
jgi:hypothetical protein